LAELATRRDQTSKNLRFPSPDCCCVCSLSLPCLSSRAAENSVPFVSSASGVHKSYKKILLAKYLFAYASWYALGWIGPLQKNKINYKKTALYICNIHVVYSKRRVTKIEWNTFFFCCTCAPTMFLTLLSVGVTCCTMKKAVMGTIPKKCITIQYRYYKFWRYYTRYDTNNIVLLKYLNTDKVSRYCPDTSII
jgi:hypothetical protein